eukprot:2585283-Pleurochrysis_carterae.AAC.1
MNDLGTLDHPVSTINRRSGDGACATWVAWLGQQRQERQDSTAPAEARNGPCGRRTYRGEEGENIENLQPSGAP